MNSLEKNSTSSPAPITARPRLNRVKLSLLSNQRLGFALLIGISLMAGLILPFAPEKIQVLLIAVPVALIIGFLIILYPFLGIIAFFIYDYMRPDNYFAFLVPLHLAIQIEAIAAGAWIVHLLARRTRIQWTSFHWKFVLFLGIIGSTVFTALNQHRVYLTFEALLVLFAIFVLTTNVVDTMKKLWSLVVVLMMVHFFFAIRGIQTGGFVGGSVMFDENDLALAMNVFVPFAYFAMINAKRIWSRSYFLAMMVSCVLAIVISLSRGGTVGLVAVALYLIIKSKQKLVGFAVMALLGLAVIVVAPGKYWEDVQTITDMSESTAQHRIEYWKASLRMFADYPLTGVGAGNGGIRMPEYIRGVRNASTEWGRTFHGTLPQILGELGGLGVAAYLWMLYHAVMMLIRLRKQTFSHYQRRIHMLADSILGGIIGFMVPGTFLSTAFYPQLWTMYTLAITLFLISRRYVISDQTDNGNRKKSSQPPGLQPA